MTRGIVPVSPHRPCAERDDDVLPVLTITTFFWGAETEQVKSLLNVHVFWKFPFENRRIQI